MSQPSILPPDAFRARTGLARIAALGGAGVGIAALGASGHGIPCPWRTLTGTLCPICGSTTLGIRLLHGDLPGAIAANPFTFTILLALAALTVLWTIEALGGPKVRPPRWVRTDADAWWLALGVLGLTFAVLRNVW